jgi:glutamate--cysteine ligase
MKIMESALQPILVTEVLIENHVEAVNEYRIILWKDKPIDVISRIPANVTGDGVSTIEELIVKKNGDRHEKFGTLFEDIVIDESLVSFLKTKQLSLSNIPSPGTIINVRNMCNLSQGGETKRVPLTSIHADYLDLFKIVHQSTWLNYCGIDLITPDITKQPVVGKTAINELNGAPGITLACFADLVEGRPLFGVKEILRKMEFDPIQVLIP